MSKGAETPSAYFLRANGLMMACRTRDRPFHQVDAVGNGREDRIQALADRFGACPQVDDELELPRRPVVWRDRMAVGTNLRDSARISSPKPASCDRTPPRWPPGHDPAWPAWCPVVTTRQHLLIVHQPNQGRLNLILLVGDHLMTGSHSEVR